MKLTESNQLAAEEVNLMLPAYDIALYFMPLFCILEMDAFCL